MKQAEVEAIAYEINDHFTRYEVYKLIQAIEEAPNILVNALEEYWKE